MPLPQWWHLCSWASPHYLSHLPHCFSPLISCLLLSSLSQLGHRLAVQQQCERHAFAYLNRRWAEIAEYASPSFKVRAAQNVKTLFNKRISAKMSICCQKLTLISTVSSFLFSKYARHVFNLLSLLHIHFYLFVLSFNKMFLLKKS